MLIMLTKVNNCEIACHCLYEIVTKEWRLTKGIVYKTHATRTMSSRYPVVIKHCLFPSAQAEACDMFIKQQGSHYCTQQPRCHNAHTKLVTHAASGMLSVALLPSLTHFFLYNSSHPLSFPPFDHSAGGIVCHF